MGFDWDAEIAAAREHAGEPRSGTRALAWSVLREVLRSEMKPPPVAGLAFEAAQAWESGMDGLAAQMVDALVLRGVIRA